MKEIILLCILIFLTIIIAANVTNYQEGFSDNSETNPYVLSNTTIETGKDFLEKKTYMEDTCGNFLSSKYNSVIHSVSKFFQKSLSSASPKTAEDCKEYQTFETNPDTGNSTCSNVCKDTQQYFDSTSKSCRYCPIGYTNDGNNNCVPLETCPYGYKYTDHTKNCNTCPAGQKFDDKINCVNICLDYETFQKDGTCKLKCPRRTQRWEKESNSCVSCPAGYLADDHNNCVPAPTCPPGQFPDQEQNCVSKCTDDWTRYDVTSNTCMPRCYDGQHLVNNKCEDCPENTMSDGKNNCLPKPTEPPPSCHQGYTYDIVQKKCVSVCPVGYKNNLFNSLQCDPICYGYSFFSNGTCIACPDGQVSDGKNGCKAAPTPAPTHPVCSSGYQLTTDKATGKETCQSICPPNRINNKLNPLVCDFICEDPNEVYNPTTKSCTPCEGNTTPNDEKTQCLQIAASAGSPVSILGDSNSAGQLSSKYNTANWIWNVPYAATAATPNQYIWFYHNFVYKGNAMMGQVYALVNNIGALYLNGQSIGSIGSNWGAYGTGTILPISLQYGGNQIKVAAYTTGGPGGLIMAIFDGNGTQIGQTDQTWTYQCSSSFAGNDIIECKNDKPIVSNFVATAVSPTAIRVSFTGVKATCGVFNIDIEPRHGLSHNTTYNDVNEYVSTATSVIDNLLPQTNYTVTMKMFNQNRDAGKEIIMQTTASTPNTPPPPPPPATPPATIPPTTKPPPPTPAPWTSDNIGSSDPGTDFRETCSGNNYITKLTGRGGAWVDKVGAECNNGSTLNSYGGNGGSPKTVSCADGMKGVRLQWGRSSGCNKNWYVGIGSIKPICMNDTEPDQIGANSCGMEVNNVPVKCPPGMRVAGFFGSDTRGNANYNSKNYYVSRFGIICKAIPS